MSSFSDDKYVFTDRFTEQVPLDQPLGPNDPEDGEQRYPAWMEANADGEVPE